MTTDVIGTVNSRSVFLVLIVLYVCFQFGCCIPKRGNEPWSVILCKFADVDFEPQTKQWFQQWFSGVNQSDSVERYFDDVSNKVYSIKGSQVHGWYKLSQSLDQVRELAESDKNLQSNEEERYFALYDKTKQLCIKAAEDAGEYLHERKITVINAEHSAVYGKKYGILVTPKLIFSSVITHEMVHSFYIGHSYSDRSIKVFPHASVGEYDDVYDLMSTANALMHQSPFGYSGPGLNGPHLDYLGWLPMHRISFFGRDGRSNYTLRVSSNSVAHKDTKGWLLVMIPYDRDDPGNVFTVEFRTKSRQDSGIKQDAVVIHKVKRVGANYYSAVMTHAENQYELQAGEEWVNFLGLDSESQPQYIKVRIEAINAAQNYADVRIMSTFDPDACNSQELVVKVGSSESSHKLNHLCVPKSGGYNKGDLLKQQKLRNRFYKDRLTFGMNECIAGKVWRSIDPYDYVCVKASRIMDIISDAKTNPLRQSEGGRCKKPFVLRNAFYGDKVCVTTDQRVQIRQENLNSSKNFKYYSFFNGEDTVEEATS